MSTGEGAAAPADRGGLWRIALQMRVSGVLAFLAILCAVFSILAPQFPRLENFMAIGSNAAILAVVAAAQTIVLLSRGLDVSVGAIMGLVGFLSASYAAQRGYAGVDLLLLAPALGAVLGAVNGSLVAYGRVSPLVATLGTMSLYRGITYIYAGGVDVAADRLPPLMLTLANARVLGAPLIIFVCAAIVALLALFLRLSPLGHRIYAIGSNPLAGVFFGLRSERVTLLAFTLCGMTSGLAGLLSAARVGTVTVVLGSGWELTSLAAAVLGGVSIAGGSGSVVGAALGALVLATIDNGLLLLGISEFWRMLVQGGAIVGAVAVDVFINSQLDRSLLRKRFGGRLA